MPELSGGVEYVRICDPRSGAEYSYDVAKVEALDLGDHVIDKAALGPDGRPAPVKPRMPLGEPRPGSKQDRRRTTGRSSTTQTPGRNDPGQDAGQSSATPQKEN